MYVQPNNAWSADDYIEYLYRVFRNHGTYRDKVGRNTRCVVIDYAEDRRSRAVSARPDLLGLQQAHRSV